MTEVKRVSLTPYGSLVNVVDVNDKLYTGTAEDMTTLEAAGVHTAVYDPNLNSFYVIYNKPADQRMTTTEFEATFGAEAFALVSQANQTVVIDAHLATEAAAAKEIQDTIDTAVATGNKAAAEQHQREVEELEKQLKLELSLIATRIKEGFKDAETDATSAKIVTKLKAELAAKKKASK